MGAMNSIFLCVCLYIGHMFVIKHITFFFHLLLSFYEQSETGW